MSSILEELYLGNIRPDTTLYTHNPRYIKVAKIREEIYESLSATLTESEKKLLDRYIEAEKEMDAISHYNTFAYALKFGAVFMSEIFTGANQITRKSGLYRSKLEE